MFAEIGQLTQKALTAPFWAFSQPDKRLFIGFILSSVVLALLIVHHKYGLSWRSIRRVFFNRNYWLHRSSKQDVVWLFLNSVLRISLVAPLLATHLVGLVFVSRFLQQTFSDAPDLSLSPTLVIALFSVCFFVIEDFSRFFLHFLMHKVPWLWRIHQTHHSAEVLTPLTLYRSHPLEMVFYQVRQLVVFSAVGGVFVWLFGSSANTWAILGVDALGFIFNLAGANLRHSHIWLSFGRLERLFISPAQHQIHHSADIRHWDTNFGTCLAIWDQLAGSWRMSKGNRVTKVGLTEDKHLPFWDALLLRRGR